MINPSKRQVTLSVLNVVGMDIRRLSAQITVLSLLLSMALMIRRVKMMHMMTQMWKIQILKHFNMRLRMVNSN
jgi:hypothetical protein